MTPEDLAGLTIPPLETNFGTTTSAIDAMAAAAVRPETVRRRTIEWEDPVASLERFAGLTGLEAMQGIADGTLPPPPISRLLGFDHIEVEHGRANFFIEPAEYHYNPIGVVHGGLAGTLLDSAMGCSVHTTLPVGAAYTTLEFKVNLVRAITRETGMIRAEGVVIHVGGRVATAEGRLYAESTGELLAHATTTCLIMRRKTEAARTTTGAHSAPELRQAA